MLPIRVNSFFSFAEDSIDFECHYARSVNANSDMTVTTPPSIIINTGDLIYSMEVDAGPLGGNTDITISPNHSLSGISPR